MNKIVIPEKATGRIGMVAVLKRVRECDLGKLVVLREPAGFLTSLIGSAKPVFAWLVQSLGEPIDCAGKASHAIYVADACLSPVAEMSEAELQGVISSQNQENFDQALIEAGNILGEHEITEDELDVLLEQACEQALVQRTLRIVATPVALHEIGFKSAMNGGSELQWTGVHEGVELRVSANPDLYDRWLITGISHSTRHWQFEEHVLVNELPRGKVFLTVLEVWRTAFGRSMVPDQLLLGDIYERHLADMRRMNPGPPVLYADPQIFRATLKWLAERHLTTPDSVHELSLSFSDGLLWFRIDDATYTCPARGQWIGDCAISAVDLTNLPPRGRRGQIMIDQCLDHIIVNGYPMAARQLDSDAIYATPEAIQPVQAASDVVPVASFEVREIEYYDDSWDSDNYYVCINHHYIFAANRNDASPQWKLLNTNYSHWDAIHQRIYRNFRSDKITKEQLPPHLPPPPETIPPEVLNPPPPPPPKPHLVVDYPILSQYLSECEGKGTMAVFLQLMEDLYESLNGDGKFHYPEAIFFDLESARRGEDGAYRYHIRPGLIWLDGDKIGAKVPGRMFDHFSIDEVFKMVTEKIERDSEANDARAS
jgi:hypothetical protein